MTSIRKITRLLVAGALVVVGLVGTSEATTISVVPGSQTIGVGGTATVDIDLDFQGSTASAGGFSLDLGFNPAILGVPESYTIDPGGVMGPGALDFSGGFTSGNLDLFYTADLAAFPTDALLKASEGTGFTLATVTFTGLAAGVSPLTLTFQPADGAFLSDYAGTGTLPATAVNGSVCVADPLAPAPNCVAASAVPEPATLTLLGGGLAALVSRRRRKAVSQA